MFCAKCGNDLTGFEGSFCGKCGTAVGGNTTETRINKPKKKIPVKIIAAILAVLLIAGIGVSLFADNPQAGNTPGNIINGGTAAIQGNQIYYINGSDGDKIYSIRTDGSDRRKINDDSSGYVNVVGNRIYYVNYDDNKKIYSIRTDGSDRRKINDDSSLSINVVGNMIYYHNSDDGGKLYSMRIDGSNKLKLNDVRTISINVVGDRIFYLNSYGLWSIKIYSMNTDGSNEQKLSDHDARSISVVGDRIFYNALLERGRLYTIRTDGTGRELVQ